MQSTATLKTSHILQNIISDAKTGGTVSVGNFIAMLGDRSFYLAILIFSLPNSLPIPGIPGFSTITGLPITFIALQLMVGRQFMWLPAKIASKQFSKQTLASLLSKALPAVIWLEKFLRPRWLWLNTPYVDRFVGFVFVALSLIIALPIPGGNFLPGLSMSLIALAMLEKDGALLSVSLAFAAASTYFMIGIIELFFKALIKGFHKLF